MNKETIGFKIAQRFCTTMASSVILLLLLVEVTLGVFYIAFYFVTGLQTPMFALVEWAGDKFSKMRYVDNV